MLTKTITVQNIHGIHCRPSSAIVKGAKAFSSDIFAEANGEKANLNNILELISMGLPQNSVVTISAEGEDQEHALETVCTLFEDIYDYPDK